ncbi:hypothetical protein [Kiritimatiella glycovorans]|nr:hypothetical protein [Kiritimatiella glycovorans]
MKRIIKAGAGIPGVLLVLFGAPLLGAMLAGHPPARYLEFPPLTRYVEHPGFRPAVFFPLSAVALLLVGCAGAIPFRHRKSTAFFAPPRGRWPVWGWSGLILVAVFWWLGWTRFAWFEPLRPYAFPLLWAGYILTANALVERRAGHCPLTEHTGRYLLLFPASAVFWWYFEYLNRFVQNWHYVGVERFGAVEYTLFATLSFSTVLPAVTATAALLKTVPGLTAGYERLPPLPVPPKRVTAWGCGIIGVAGLAGVGALPVVFFPLLWLAPLFFLIAAAAARGRPTPFHGLERGDGRFAVRWALAALCCGFFWELWNYGSDPKWIYLIPWVDAVPVFEMPILGYLGYLPFGLECAAVVTACGLRTERPNRCGY